MTYTSKYMAIGLWPMQLTAEKTWANCMKRANTENRYVLEEQLAIRLDSDMDMQSAVCLTLDEWFSPIQHKHRVGKDIVEDESMDTGLETDEEFCNRYSLIEGADKPLDNLGQPY